MGLSKYLGHLQHVVLTVFKLTKSFVPYSVAKTLKEQHLLRSREWFNEEIGTELHWTPLHCSALNYIGRTELYCTAVHGTTLVYCILLDTRNNELHFTTRHWTLLSLTVMSSLLDALEANSSNADFKKRPISPMEIWRPNERDLSTARTN